MTNIINFGVCLFKKINITKDVMWLPANDVYVVFNGKKELLIPIVPEIVLCLDYRKQEIVISSVDGLID